MEVEEFRISIPDYWIRSVYDAAVRSAWIDFVASARPSPTMGEWRFGEGSTVHINAFEDEKPGTPLAEHFNEIAVNLKKIEAERQKECQAAEIPEEKN